MDGFLLYNINKVSDVVAFTTKRSVGRDREAICCMLGIDDAHLVYPHQTHGTVVRQIGKEFIALSADTKKMILEGVDAVFT
ncbi:MAG: polyphenol oxidase, partial [Prevotella sp.]|nr:polyphenol oxidase [Prevotella sp.]